MSDNLRGSPFLTAQIWPEQVENANYFSHNQGARRIKIAISLASSGKYVRELVASGSQVHGIYPLVEARIDGTKVGQFQLLVGGWRTYPLEVELNTKLSPGRCLARRPESSVVPEHLPKEPGYISDRPSMLWGGVHNSG